MNTVVFECDHLSRDITVSENIFMLYSCFHRVISNQFLFNTLFNQSCASPLATVAEYGRVKNKYIFDF